MAGAADNNRAGAPHDACGTDNKRPCSPAQMRKNASSPTLEESIHTQPANTHAQTLGGCGTRQQAPHTASAIVGDAGVPQVPPTGKAVLDGRGSDAPLADRTPLNRKDTSPMSTTDGTTGVPDADIPSTIRTICGRAGSRQASWGLDGEGGGEGSQ